MFCYCTVRFRSDNDEKYQVERWTTPVIFEIYKIFEDLNIEKVLDNVLDKRKSEINNLSKKQLIDECKKQELPVDGKKVSLSNMIFCP